VLRQSLSLRRSSVVLIGGAFELLFGPEGREFEEDNLQKFKCPGVARGGMLNFRIDRRITRPTAMASKVNDRIGKVCERLSLFIPYTVKGRRMIVNKSVTTAFEAFLLFFAALLYTYHYRCLLLCLTN